MIHEFLYNTRPFPDNNYLWCDQFQIPEYPQLWQRLPRTWPSHLWSECSRYTLVLNSPYRRTLISVLDESTRYLCSIRIRPIIWCYIAYQWLNPGEIVDSKIPRKNRTVANPANELQAAVNMMIPDHVIMLTIVKTILVRQSPTCEESGRSTSKKLGDRKSLHQ